MPNFAYPSGWDSQSLSATQGNTVAQEPSFWEQLGAASQRAGAAGGGLAGLGAALTPSTPSVTPAGGLSQSAMTPITKPQAGGMGNSLGGLGALAGALKF